MSSGSNFARPSNMLHMHCMPCHAGYSSGYNLRRSVEGRTKGASDALRVETSATTRRGDTASRGVTEVTKHVAAVVVLMLLSGVVHAQGRVLTFAKKIGAPWDAGQNGWMSFVAFSGDGRVVVSDGPAPDRESSRGLSFWTFPDGQFVKSLAVDRHEISDDWKYAVRNDAVVDLQAGKEILSLPRSAAIVQFSPDSRYIAVSLSTEHEPGSHIRVLEVASGAGVSAFGEYAPRSLAIGPDNHTFASGRWDIVKLWDVVTGERIAVLRGFGST